MSSTASNETLHAADADPVPTVLSLLALGANAERKTGTSTVLLRKRLHLTGTMPSTGDDLCCTAIPSAPSPCANRMRENPDVASMAAIRSLAAPRAAMPTSAHAPHCTLTAATPCVRRDVASASRHVFAAA